MANVKVTKLPRGINEDGSLKSIPAIIDPDSLILENGTAIGQGGTIDLGGGVGCYMDTVNIPYGKDYLILIFNDKDNAADLLADGFSYLSESLNVALIANGTVEAGTTPSDQVEPCTFEPLEANLFTTLCDVSGTFTALRPSKFFSNNGEGWALKIAYPDWLSTSGKPTEEEKLPHILVIDMDDEIQGGC